MKIYSRFTTEVSNALLGLSAGLMTNIENPTGTGNLENKGES